MTDFIEARSSVRCSWSSLPWGDLKTLWRVIPPSGMFKSNVKVVTRTVRNREPSREPFQKKVIQPLKYRKLRQKSKKMLQKTVPVLHSIAANYKLWKTRFIWREDSFYNYYCKSTKKWKMICNSSERRRYYSFSLMFCLVLPLFCARLRFDIV